MFESDRAFRLPGDDALESKPPPAPFVAPSSDSVSDRVMLNIASAAFSVSKAGASAALRSAIAIDIPKAGCASAPPKDGGAPGGAAAAPPPSGGEGSRCCTRGSRLICETRSGRPRMKSACWYRPASAPFDILWKPYKLSWRWKLVIFECRKCRGRTSLQNFSLSFTRKELPLSLHDTIAGGPASTSSYNFIGKCMGVAISMNVRHGQTAFAQEGLSAREFQKTRGFVRRRWRSEARTPSDSHTVHCRRSYPRASCGGGPRGHPCQNSARRAKPRKTTLVLVLSVFVCSQETTLALRRNLSCP
mmetsp:Transcript_83790/g.236775  ORF Transcript_83790/g.236775 Transcript_83790/m.236775 type:complete len:303 (-) Transcript_83790:156-1064(-)